MGDPDTQLTLVAYLGEKPETLDALLRDCQARITATLGDGFTPYGLEQIHATIVGLERAAGAGRQNANLKRLRGRRKSMEIERFLASLADDPLLPFHVRFGGFARSHRPFASRCRTPWERTFSVQGDKAVLIGWPVLPGTLDRYPATLERLRRRAEGYNILHAYHRTPDDRDNDLYLRLGTVRGRPREEGASGPRDHDALEAMLREALAVRPVTLPLSLDDLAVAVYSDPSLPSQSTRRIDPRTAGALDDLIPG